MKRLHAADCDYYDDVAGEPSLTKTNSSLEGTSVSEIGGFEIVNGRKYAVPAESEYHLGDAANCLSRMVNSGREVPDERDSFLL